MADFFKLPNKERREALTFAADASGRPIHLLEKDVWVVWSLQQIFGDPYAPHLVFKGGTSLSKACQVIRRFAAGARVRKPWAGVPVGRAHPLVDLSARFTFDSRVASVEILDLAMY